MERIFGHRPRFKECAMHSFSHVILETLEARTEIILAGEFRRKRHHFKHSSLFHSEDGRLRCTGNEPEQDLQGYVHRAAQSRSSSGVCSHLGCDFVPPTGAVDMRGPHYTTAPMPLVRYVSSLNRSLFADKCSQGRGSSSVGRSAGGGHYASWLGRPSSGRRDCVPLQSFRRR